MACRPRPLTVGYRYMVRYSGDERSISKNRVRESLVRQTSGKHATTFGRQGDPRRRRELVFLLGGALMTARILRIQQKALPVIGFLSNTSPGADAGNVAAFRQGLRDIGYIEGQNLAIEY